MATDWLMRRLDIEERAAARLAYRQFRGVYNDVLDAREATLAWMREQLDWSR